MAVTIKRVRLSSIQSISLPAMIGNSAVPGPHLSTVADYYTEFQKASQENAGWRLPWCTDPASRLWRRMVDRTNLAQVQPADAWKRMVPLFSAPDGPTVTTGADVQVHRYLLPGAVSIVITVTITGSLTLEAALAAIVEARRNPIYRWQPEQEPFSLTHLHEELIATCQNDLLGGPDPGTSGDRTPLSIVSVLDAAGGPEDAIVAQDNQIHRLLYGFCAFDKDSLRQPVPRDAALTSSALSQSSRSGGATLLAFHRGRAFWSPAKMFKAPWELDRYHRHLTASSAVVDGLLTLVADERATSANQAGFGLGKLAVQRLGMFYGPARDIWSSTSIRRQIDESDAMPAIQDLREMFALAPLSARTSAP